MTIPIHSSFSNFVRESSFQGSTSTNCCGRNGLTRKMRTQGTSGITSGSVHIIHLYGMTRTRNLAGCAGPVADNPVRANQRTFLSPNLPQLSSTESPPNPVRLCSSPAFVCYTGTVQYEYACCGLIKRYSTAAAAVDRIPHCALFCLLTVLLPAWAWFSAVLGRATRRGAVW